MKRASVLLIVIIVFCFVLIFAETVPNQLVNVKGGTFIMGNTRIGEGEMFELPAHEVELTYDFYIGKYEVTFDEYYTFCDETVYYKPTDCGWGKGTRPIMYVSWFDATNYCNWLSEKEELPKAYDAEGNLLDRNGNITTDITQVTGYRLPTEAEWEYAARGGHIDIKNGIEENDFKFSGSNDIDEVAWYDKNSAAMTQEIGQKKSNELEIFDMTGNVWEWCHDWFGNYSSEKQINPIGPSSSPYYSRIYRGGSWFYYPLQCRISYRTFHNPQFVATYVGFRVCRTEQ